MKVRIKSTLYHAARLFLGAVFIYACWDKILDPAAFAKAIDNYQILPSRAVMPAALLLPWLELVAGASLILNRWTQGAALVVSLLMVIFMIALGVNIARGVDISCGCFTLDETAPSSMWHTMIRDVMLLAMALSLWVVRNPKTVVAGAQNSPSIDAKGT